MVDNRRNTPPGRKQDISAKQERIRSEQADKKLSGQIEREGKLTREQDMERTQHTNKKLDKLKDVFKVMRKGIEKQTQYLKESLQIAEAKQIFDIEALKEQREKDALEKVSKTKYGADDKGGKSGVGQISPEELGEQAGQKAGIFAFFGRSPGLGMALSGFLGSAIGAVSGRLSAAYIGGWLLRAVPLAMIAPVVGDFLGQFITQGLKNVNILEDDEFAGKFETEISGALTTGLFGLMFGKKIGGAFLVGDIIRRTLENSLGLDFVDSIAGSIGTKVPEEMKESIGSAFGAAVGLALLQVVRHPKFLLAPMLLGSMLYMGDEMRTGLEKYFKKQNYSNPDTLANLTVDAATVGSFGLQGATIGFYFGGAHGAVIGAVIGLALGMGHAVYNWFKRRKDKQLADLEENLSQIDKILDDKDKVARLGIVADEMNSQNMNREQREEYMDQNNFDEDEKMILRMKNASLAQLRKEIFQSNQIVIENEADGIEPERAFIRKREILQAELIERLEKERNALDNSMQILEKELGGPKAALQNPEYESMLETFKAINDELGKVMDQQVGSVQIIDTSRRDEVEIEPQKQSMKGVDARQPELLETPISYASQPENRMAPILKEVTAAATNHTSIVYAPQNISPTNVVQGPTQVSNVQSTHINSISSTNGEYGGLAGLA